MALGRSHGLAFSSPVTILSFLSQEFLPNGLFKEATTPTFSFSRNLTFEIHFKNICLCRRNTFIWIGRIFLKGSVTSFSTKASSPQRSLSSINTLAQLGLILYSHVL